MRLPNFLIIGAQKSGTTSVWSALAQHPQVFLTGDKEPHFFSHDDQYARGIEWYASLFADAEAAEAKAVGEASTSYTMNVHCPQAPARVAQHLPDARLIYVVRHPFRRMESCYHHLLFKNLSRESFAGAVKSIPHVIDTTLYWKQINLYRDHFPDERICVLFFEDFRRDADGSVRQLCRFLEIDPDAPIQDLGAKHVSEGRRFDGAFLAWCRRQPWLRRLGRALPKRLRKTSEKALMKEISGKPEWSPELKEYVLSRIEADSLQFLRFYGKQADYWKFREEESQAGAGSG